MAKKEDSGIIGWGLLHFVGKGAIIICRFWFRVRAFFTGLSGADMSGHSHWAGIKYKKAVTDAKRGKLWCK